MYFLFSTFINFQPQHAGVKGKEKLSDALKSCNDILKELFAKKHSVSVMFFFSFSFTYITIKIVNNNIVFGII